MLPQLLCSQANLAKACLLLEGMNAALCGIKRLMQCSFIYDEFQQQ